MKLKDCSPGDCITTESRAIVDYLYSRKYDLIFYMGPINNKLSKNYDN